MSRIIRRLVAVVGGLAGAGLLATIVVALPATARGPIGDPLPWTYTGGGTDHRFYSTDYGGQSSVEFDSGFGIEITLEADGTVSAIHTAQSPFLSTDCADSPGEMRVTDDPDFEFEPLQFTGTHGDGSFRLELPNEVEITGTYMASEIEGHGEHSGSYSACDGVAGLGGVVVVEFGWTRTFLATRPTPTAETSPTAAADDPAIRATDVDSAAPVADEGTVGVEAQDAVPPPSSDEGGGIPAAVIIGTVVLVASGIAIAKRLGVRTSGAAPPPPPPPEPGPPEPPGPGRYPRGPGDKAEPRVSDPTDDGIDPTESESATGPAG